MLRSPLITLAAVGAGLGGLLLVNATQAADNTTAAEPPAAGIATTAPTQSPTGTVPSPSPTTAPPTTQPTVPPTSPPPTQPPSVPPSKPPRDFPGRIVYAGRTVDRHASIAIAVLNGRSAAYFCDGRSVESWFTGTATGGRIALFSKKGATVEARLTGTDTTGTITGAVRIDGRTFRFTVDRAEHPAGLYRGKATNSGRSTTIGWIVLPDGSQVGIAATGTTKRPAPRLDPATGTATVDGTPVRAYPLSGATTF